MALSSKAQTWPSASGGWLDVLTGHVLPVQWFLAMVQLRVSWVVVSWLDGWPPIQSALLKMGFILVVFLSFSRYRLI
jgi:hypothetical protein